jgi:hypothetical protein
MNKTLQFKTSSPLSIGLDIGGTLTKITILVIKECLNNNFNIEYDFQESLELPQHYLFFKYIQTAAFKSEGINLLKSI